MTVKFWAPKQNLQFSSVALDLQTYSPQTLWEKLTLSHFFIFRQSGSASFLHGKEI
jgi:hypothetical protein